MFEHPFNFDPTYGYNKEALLNVGLPNAPTDFDTFWQDTFSQTQSVPLQIQKEPETTTSANVDVFTISFHTLDKIRIGGWLVAPKNTQPTSGFVISHGYGGRTEPVLNFPIPNAVALLPCAPGFHRSAHTEIPNTSQKHVIHHIEDRNTYIIRHSVASLWSAASVLLELYPTIQNQLYFSGGSFGGGLGALALPWDARFKKAHLSVPTFGHHPIRLQCPCNGSGEAVRLLHQEKPEIAHTLQYFDAATAASHIQIPVLGSPALFDPSVPPPGQFAVCNALSNMHILSAGHFTYDTQVEEQKTLQQELTKWFTSS
jgi:cephalosporin-C deacetylase